MHRRFETEIQRAESVIEMIDMFILIGCIIVSGCVGYTAGYNHGYDDGILYQVKKQIDDRRKKIKHD